jgi:hypothetical protein
MFMVRQMEGLISMITYELNEVIIGKLEEG